MWPFFKMPLFFFRNMEKFKFSPFYFAEKKNNQKGKEKEKKDEVILLPFSTKLFLGISKHRLHIHETGDLEPYLQCTDKNTLLRRTHRVYEILPGSKKICCMVYPFLQFLAVKSSKSVKTRCPLWLCSLRCTSCTASHIQMWALM